MLLAAVIALILVHGPKGTPIQINVKTISNIREVGDVGKEHIVAGTRCVLSLTNGKFVAVAETCKEVIALVRDAN